MRESISRDSASPRELVEATRRLDRALERLEAACAAKAGAASGGALDGAAYAALQGDRVRLAADLDVARRREEELEAAALAASLALGRAADEVRAALGDDDGCDDALGAEDGVKPEGDEFNEEAA